MATLSVPQTLPTNLETFETLATKEDHRRRRIVIGTIITVLLLIGVFLAWLGARGTIHNGFFLGYLASLIGGGVGAGELIARYRDAPFASLVRNSSPIYLAFNAGAAAAAFFLINTFGWTFETVAPDTPAASSAIQVLVAGFGAMALFRSSLFIARIGDQENVGIGPSIVLQTVLDAADAGVDREAAMARAPAVEQIMQSVDADKAKHILPLFCRGLLQSSLPEGQYDVMERKINETLEKASTEKSKAYLLGLILMNYMGASVLEVAVRTLGRDIKRSPQLHLKDIIKEIDDNEGGEVEIDYQPLISAEDAEGNPITLSCNPPSGSKFPVGQTTIVTCEAKDDKTGLATRESFKVTLTRKSDIYTVKDKDTLS